MHISTQVQTFTYLGSKYSILPWLLPLLPASKSWVDVFGGSMVTTLNRPQSSIETYNDLNQMVVHFFRMLRDHPEELIRALHLTPYSRQEYEEAWHHEEDNDIEKARKFFVRIRQSMFATGAQNQKKGWKSATQETRCKISEATNKYLKSVAGLHEIITRIKNIQIENRDFRWLIPSYDTPETLFYCDPPYDREMRSGVNDYQHDFNEQDHLDLRALAKSVKGKIAVSGYSTPFMKELYSDFYLTVGPEPRNNKSLRKTRECLWTNYDPLRANPTLF